jgi:iron complex outermembrane receptor protein
MNGRTRCVAIAVTVLLSLLTVPALLAAEQGRIEGRVLSADGAPLGGVSVIVRETNAETLTDRDGNYAFADLLRGKYTLIFIHSEQQETRSEVEVRAGETSVLDLGSDWQPTFTESLTVYGASRKQERIVEAPAAVTVISEQQIERESSHGQLPKVLEFTPGAEVTQSGLYDFNFNTRGFNSSLNRRVATLIDGRDPSLPFLGAQEWAGVGFPLDELASAELIRGPSAALYGANASSGVLNLTTKEPRYSQGGLVRLTGGEVDSRHVDFRFADEIGGGWYWKVAGGRRDSGDFAVSRNAGVEYSIPCTVPGQSDCLPPEVVPLDPFQDNEITFGSLRFDHYGDNGGAFTIEGGTSSIEGPVFQTGIGRVQVVEADRPWARANYAMDHWNFLVHYTARDAPTQISMSSGANLVLDTFRVAGELQTNWDFGDGHRVVGGVYYEHEDIDTFDPLTGSQSAIFQPITTDSRAAFAQLDIEASERVKVVLAGRYDHSSLHDSQLSPKASVVFSAAPNHTLRFTYNEAFQVANYSEFFLQVPFPIPGVGTSIDLSGAEAALCTPFAVDCGFGTPTPILAVGNETLDLEEITTFEVGYSGILGDSAFLTLDYYHSDNKDFITDLVPQFIGLDRTNPNFGPYAAPAVHPDPLLVETTVAGLLGPLAPFLTNNLDGSPILTPVTYTNFGEVDTQGADLGLNLFFNETTHASFSASWFDFEIQNPNAPLAGQLQPNTPDYKVSLAVGQTMEQVDWSVSVRRVDDFRWAVGPFQGDVPAYTTFDASYNYRFGESWSAGVNIGNLFDNEHYQAFGGDVLERRALAHVAYAWKQ